MFVHLSDSVQAAADVGKRHGHPIVYAIDCEKMAERGYLFYKAAEHIWLVKDIPPEFLSAVTDVRLPVCH